MLRGTFLSPLLNGKAAPRFFLENTPTMKTGIGGFVVAV